MSILSSFHTYQSRIYISFPYLDLNFNRISKYQFEL